MSKILEVLLCASPVFSSLSLLVGRYFLNTCNLISITWLTFFKSVLKCYKLLRLETTSKILIQKSVISTAC